MPINIGGSVHLFSVKHLAKLLHCSVNAATRTLAALQVPTVALSDYRYFNLITLEEAMFAVLDLGGPGFVAPGARCRPTSGVPTTALPKSALDPDRRKDAQARIGALSTIYRDRARRNLGKALAKTSPSLKKRYSG
jgi:hypothetical protein